jgi:hypothetical protein
VVSVVAVLTVAVALGAAVAVGILALMQPSSDPIVDAEVGASDDGYAVWARNDDGEPVRWDPCSPVRIVVGSPGAPPTYPTAELRRDVESAAATLAEATGLDIVVEDTVEEVPDGDRSTVETTGDGRRWAPVLLGWRAPGEGGLPLRDVDRGIAVPVAVGPAGARVYVTAQVVLNPERADLVAGTADRGTSWGATVLHELAHVLGLGHVDDERQLMHTYPGRGPVALGDGDLAGLAAVGARDGTCLPVPRPQELEVELPSS